MFVIKDKTDNDVLCVVFAHHLNLEWNILLWRRLIICDLIVFCSRCKPCWSSRQERTRFVWYSVYAWSTPLLFVILTMVMELTPIVPDAYLKPNFGVQSCWFRSK